MKYLKTTGNSTFCVYFNVVCYTYNIDHDAFCRIYKNLNIYLSREIGRFDAIVNSSFCLNIIQTWKYYTMSQ